MNIIYNCFAPTLSLCQFVCQSVCLGCPDFRQSLAREDMLVRLFSSLVGAARLGMSVTGQCCDVHTYSLVEITSALNKHSVT